jgi:hypothetical protein
MPCCLAVEYQPFWRTLLPPSSGWSDLQLRMRWLESSVLWKPQISCRRLHVTVFWIADAISVEQSIATAFQLRTYADVCMNIVNPEDVALDSVELTFKEQYMGRSEMWRLKNSLVSIMMYVRTHIINLFLCILYINFLFSFYRWTPVFIWIRKLNSVEEVFVAKCTKCGPWEIELLVV